MAQLPEYGRPPIDEVVIGVQFEPTGKFRAVHLGRYWTNVRDRYPNVEDQAPLAQEIEREKAVPTQAAIMFRTMLPLPRCWFLDEPGNELIQIQGDRFLRNWRRVKGDERYPRYNYLIAKFKSELEAFQAFLKEESLGEPKINQCELSYINQLEPGTGWNNYSELAKVFTTIRPAEQGFLPEPELFSWQARYKLPENKGRLHVEAQPVLRSRDFKVILSLTLTARGAPRSIAEEGVFSWFETAHEWIVKAFDQITDPRMHAIWEKK